MTDLPGELEATIRHGVVAPASALECDEPWSKRLERQRDQSLAALTELVAIVRRQEAELQETFALVDEQAEDEGLWSIHISGRQPIAEAYLQQALRRLHEAIEMHRAALAVSPPAQEPTA